MKKILSLIITFFVAGGIVFGQYEIDQYNGQTVTQCSGTFYDSGGAGAGYNDGENYTVTFCSNNPGSQIELTFTSFYVENSFEYLTAYNGVGTANTILGTWSGTSLQNGVVSSLSGGCITFTFTSDGSVSGSSGYTGWAADIACTFPCQDFSVDITNVSVPYSSGDTVDVCQGEPITFTAGGTYPNSGTNYTQNDASTTFIWNWGDGTTGTGQTLTHTFPDGGGAFVIVEGIDQNGCNNTNYELNIVRVSTTPNFNGTTLGPDTICLGEQVSFLSAIANPTPWAQTIPPPIAGTIMLPDDASGAYSTAINYGIFNIGQTLTSQDEIFSVCVNMEHSYLGDLTIQLTCPNGSTVDFLVYPSGCGSTFLGVPIDNDADLNPGVGYDYCWTPSATNGSWADNCGSFSTMPAGNYEAESPWTDLIGCPLNGDWTIYVFDNLGSDNGFIFEWMINFDPSIIPTNLMEFTNTYDPATSYNWTGDNILTQVAGTGSAQPTGQGNIPYTLTATDDFGCSYDTTISVHVLAAGSPGCCTLPIPSAGLDNAVCSLDYTLNATVAAGNTGTWSYTGPGTAVFSNITSNSSSVTVDTYGVYTFTWTEQNSPACIASDNVIITFNTLLSSAFEFADSIACYQNSTTINYLGNGTASANYTWNFGTGTATGSGQGPYTITFPPGVQSVSLSLSENNCPSDTTTLSITSPSELIAKPNQTNNICFGNCLASAWMGMEGGTPPYTYTWASGADIYSNLCAGVYNVTATDATGCSVAHTFTITEPTKLAATLSGTNSHCLQDDGSATIFPSGGTIGTGYNYLWSNSQTTQTAINLVSSIYYVTVTDFNGCILDTLISIDDEDGFDVSLDPVDHVSCFGFADASITVNVLNGGVPNFNYVFSPGTSISQAGTSYTRYNLAAGLYTITVTDLVNCSNTDFIVITQPPVLQASITGTNVSCFGGSDGTSDLTITGGTTPYSFLWNGGMVTEDVQNIQAGNYTPTITDANGCVTTATISITQPSQPLTATLTPYDVSCFGGSDGAIAISTQGGTPTYAYLWSNTETTQGIGNLVAGIFDVTVTDFNGCTFLSNATVNQPELLSYTASSTNASCFGKEDGSVSVSVIGGTIPYSYIWSNEIAGVGVTNLAAEEYFVTITDANNCTGITSVTVFEPDEVVVSASDDKIICMGEEIELNASATGGTPNYEYFWTPLNTGTEITVSPTTFSVYTVHAIDASGCKSLNAIIKVSVRPPITAEIHVDDAFVCEGDPVTFSVTATGGLPPYIYTLQDEIIDMQHVAYPETVTNYVLIVSDSCGSPVGMDDTLITPYQLPQISFSPVPQYGCVPLVVQFLDQAPFDFQSNTWDFGDPAGTMNTSNQINASHTYNEPGIYTVVLNVVSKDGCINSVTQDNLIEAYELPVAYFEPDPTLTSIINADIILNNQSTLADSCFWDFGDNSGTLEDCDPVYRYTDAGEFDIRLIVSTNHGCRDTVYYNNITIIDQFTFYAPTAFTPEEDGQNDFFSPMIRGLKEGTYEMYIFDRWGLLIFETKTYDVSSNGMINHGWDGSVYGKRPAPTGVYQWYVIYEDNEDVKHEEKGSVTVIR